MQGRDLQLKGSNDIYGHFEARDPRLPTTNHRETPKLHIAGYAPISRKAREDTREMDQVPPTLPM